MGKYFYLGPSKTKLKKCNFKQHAFKHQGIML